MFIQTQFKFSCEAINAIILLRSLYLSCTVQLATKIAVKNLLFHRKYTFVTKDYEHSLALGVLLGQNQFSSSSIILLLVESQPLPKQNIKLVLHDPREKQKQKFHNSQLSRQNSTELTNPEIRFLCPLGRHAVIKHFYNTHIHTDACFQVPHAPA